jgi:hypothetical protein
MIAPALRRAKVETLLRPPVEFRKIQGDQTGMTAEELEQRLVELFGHDVAVSLHVGPSAAAILFP